MSQLASNIVLAGRAGIALATMPSDEPEYYITYDDSSVAISFSRVMDLELTSEGKVLSIPIEKSSFAAYNKVASPSTIRSTLAVEGEAYALQSVIDTLFELKEGTELLNFVTPLHEYESYTLEKFSYQQAAEKGINVLYVEVNLSEVKEVEQQYTDTQAPIAPKAAKKAGNASTVDKGKQQATQPKDKTSWLLDRRKGQKIPMTASSQSRHF